MINNAAPWYSKGNRRTTTSLIDDTVFIIYRRSISPTISPNVFYINFRQRR